MLALAALATAPRSGSGDVYASPAPTSATCVSRDGTRLCVPVRGAALLPRLEAGLAVVSEVLATVPGVPTTFAQRPAAVGGPVIRLEPDVTLWSVPEVAAALLDATVDELVSGCDSLPLASQDGGDVRTPNLLWTEVVRDVLLLEAGLPAALPDYSDPVAPRVRALPPDRRAEWIRAAADDLARCAAPAPP